MTKPSLLHAIHMLAAFCHQVAPQTITNCLKYASFTWSPEALIQQMQQKLPWTRQGQDHIGWQWWEIQGKSLMCLWIFDSSLNTLTNFTTTGNKLTVAKMHNNDDVLNLSMPGSWYRICSWSTVLWRQSWWWHFYRAITSIHCCRGFACTNIFV